VLRRALKRLDQGQRQPNRTEWVKLRIASNDKGIASVIKDLSNPPVSAWEARTLPLSYARSLHRILRWHPIQVKEDLSFQVRA
jgi:hypothetical protein